MSATSEPAQQTQLLTWLHWHPPTPTSPVLSNTSVPLALVPLREAVIKAWEMPEPRPREPLLQYVAALQVAMRQRPEWCKTLRPEQSQVLQCLASLYDTGTGEGVARQACARALFLASYGTADLHRLLRLQGRDVASAPIMAQRYERALEKVSDATTHLYLRVGEAYWRAQTLIEASPAPIGLAEEGHYAQGHVHQTALQRDRHYRAALSTLQEPQRLWKNQDPSTLPMALIQGWAAQVEHLEAESSKVTQQREAYETAIAHYESFQDWNTIPLLVPPGATEELSLPLPEEMLDQLLLEKMDAWSMTDAAQSLARSTNPNTTPPVPFNLPNLLTKLLGASATTMTKTRTRDVTVAVIAAMSLQMQHLEQGVVGSMDKVRDLERLTVLRDKLLQALS